jgi:hypothetical protein
MARYERFLVFLSNTKHCFISFFILYICSGAQRDRQREKGQARAAANAGKAKAKETTHGLAAKKERDAQIMRDKLAASVAKKEAEAQTAASSSSTSANK